MNAATDLFGGLPHDRRRSLPGLVSRDDAISPGQEAELIARIDGCDLDPFRFQGWLGKRLTCSFGWSYDFDPGQFEQVAPLPDWLVPIRDIAARVAGLPASCLEQALLIRYDPGAGIGWHKDRPVFEHVVGLSLGNAATLRFRRRREGGFDRFSHEARPRSIYHIAGEARHQWEHSIVEMTIPRWSITFRSLAGAARCAS